jgi:hypothetical protein
MNQLPVLKVDDCHLSPMSGDVCTTVIRRGCFGLSPVGRLDEFYKRGRQTAPQEIANFAEGPGLVVASVLKRLSQLDRN